jgi:Holliday junction resolvasome RuvABC DNA-binding subunit
MKKFQKLTPELLKRIIAEEKEKLEKLGLITNKAEEKDASEYASALVNKIDYVKKLGIKEAELKAKLQRISEVKRKLASSLKDKK